jgi:hypothetical protein
MEGGTAMQQTTQRVLPGWKVIGSDDKDIGTVSDLGPNYVEISKGLILTKTLYVPYQYIAREDDVNERVYLSLGKDVVEGMGWEQPPGEGDVAGDEPTSGTSEDSGWRPPR